MGWERTGYDIVVGVLCAYEIRHGLQEFPRGSRFATTANGGATSGLTRLRWKNPRRHLTAEILNSQTRPCLAYVLGA